MALLLLPIHSLIRHMKKIARFRPVLGEKGASDADSQTELSAVAERMLTLNLAADFVLEIFHIFPIRRSPVQQNEFVAAEPEARLPGSYSFPKGLGRQDQRPVAKRMPVGVVEPFQSVEVYKHYGERALGAVLPRKEHIEISVEVSSVREIRQRVVIRHPQNVPPCSEHDRHAGSEAPGRQHPQNRGEVDQPGRGVNLLADDPGEGERPPVRQSRTQQQTARSAYPVDDMFQSSRPLHHKARRQKEHEHHEPVVQKRP